METHACTHTHGLIITYVQQRRRSSSKRTWVCVLTQNIFLWSLVNHTSNYNTWWCCVFEISRLWKPEFKLCSCCRRRKIHFRCLTLISLDDLHTELERFPSSHKHVCAELSLRATEPTTWNCSSKNSFWNISIWTLLSAFPERFTNYPKF